jgi:hypothetical protein
MGVYTFVCRKNGGEWTAKQHSMVGLSLVVNSLVLAEWQCFLLTCYCFAIVILLDAITASLFMRVIVCVQTPIPMSKV